MGKTVVRLEITIETGEYIDPIENTGEVLTGVHIGQADWIDISELSGGHTREEVEEIRKLASMGNLCDPQFSIQSAIREAVEALAIPADGIQD